jgi:hypothetical protein
MTEQFWLESVIIKETGESGYFTDKRMLDGRKQLLVVYKDYDNKEHTEWFDEKKVCVYKELVKVGGFA